MKSVRQFYVRSVRYGNELSGGVVSRGYTVVAVILLACSQRQATFDPAPAPAPATPPPPPSSQETTVSKEPIAGVEGATLGVETPDPVVPSDADVVTTQSTEPQAAGGFEARRDAAIAPVSAAVDAGPPLDAGGTMAEPVAPPDVRCRSGDAPEERTEYAEPGPFTSATFEVTVQDASRPIEATESHPAAPARVLLTRVYYPSQGPTTVLAPPPVADGGPFPVLMYSHGYSSSRDESNRVGHHAATHGFIVVAPDFPLTNIGANSGQPDVMDLAHQPADVSFLVDWMLAQAQDPSHRLFGQVDPDRIGALGVSLGGLTTLLVAFHRDMLDPRIKAIAPIAAPSFFFTERYYATRELPMLLIHGDLDAFIDYGSNARIAYDRAAPNARLLTVIDGSHTGFGAPVDGALLGLVQPIFAPPEAHPQNPDGLGCGYVAAGLAGTGPEFLQVLGGAEVGVESSEDQNAQSLPCQGDEFTMPALDLNRQMDILARSVVAFFEAHFAADEARRQEACRYLLEEVPLDAAVHLE